MHTYFSNILVLKVTRLKKGGVLSMNESTKQFLINNKSSIEMFQWALMNSVASLVYSDYIASIRQKQFPVRKVLVPVIKDLEYIMDPRGELLRDLPEYLLDRIRCDVNDYYAYSIPEFDIFNMGNDSSLKDLMNEYIIPNISRRIPETIKKKFGLDDPNQQVIREDRNIKMFDKYPLDGASRNFIAAQTILQFFTMGITIEKECCPIEHSTGICLPLDKHYILSIANDQAVCPIQLNAEIIDNPIFGLISFVTGTTIADRNDDEIILQTLPLNMVGLTRLITN